MRACVVVAHSVATTPAFRRVPAAWNFALADSY
jgi:hypothetical protein